MWFKSLQEQLYFMKSQLASTAQADQLNAYIKQQFRDIAGIDELQRGYEDIDSVVCTPEHCEYCGREKSKSFTCEGCGAPR